MTNIITNNTTTKANLIHGSMIERILNETGKAVVEDKKTYADRKAIDGRRGWIKKRDRILSNIQHEINIYSLEDEEKREAYLKYWGDKNSLNKDKFYNHLEESDSIGEKNVFKRRIVKAEYSHKNVFNGYKADGKTKKFKREDDELLGYEIDIMIGYKPLLGSIIDTKIDTSTKDDEEIKYIPIMKKITNKDGSPKIDEKTGKQKENLTWRNNTIKNMDGSYLKEEELVSFLTKLKVGFEGDNFKQELIQIHKDMKSEKTKETSTSETSLDNSMSENVMIDTSEENVSESVVS